MATILIGDKAFENELVVVYEVRDGAEDKPVSEVAVVSKTAPEEWEAFGGSKDIAGLIFAKAYRAFQSTGEWPSRVHRQS